MAGFAIPSAVFILVVLAGLGAYLLSMSSTQALNEAQDVLSAKAKLAARAGLDWGSYQLIKAAPAPAFKTACEAQNYASTTPATTALASGALPALNGFRVDLECKAQQHDEAGNVFFVYDLTATACNATACPATSPGLGYAELRMAAILRP